MRENGLQRRLASQRAVIYRHETDKRLLKVLARCLHTTQMVSFQAAICLAICLCLGSANAGSTGNNRKTCVVPSYGDATKSDVPAIKKAFKQCGAGGIIKFPRGVTYYVNDFLEMEGCTGCEVQLDGTLKQGDNITHWQTQYPFPKLTSLNGHTEGNRYEVSLSSGYRLDRWISTSMVDVYHNDHSTLRPILWTVANSTRVTFENIHMINPPMWFNFIVKSSYINFFKFNLVAKSTSDAGTDNSDGFDTYQSVHVVIRDLVADISDDCVSFKPNSTNIVVENAICGGSHGVSVGSIAQYPGVYDIVENIYVRNVSFIDRLDGLHTQNGVRIKTWPGGKYGYGKVYNVTYDDIKITNVDSPIIVGTCYSNSADFCDQNPSLVDMTEVYIRNVRGISSGSKGNTVADLKCSPGAVCELHLSNIDITVPSGETPVYLCRDVDSDVGVPCTAE
ncbi:pectin lyase-like protein [Serendipita vermifera]|nr:pectin lyase-like protein [Serendipita vermifera]